MKLSGYVRICEVSNSVPLFVVVVPAGIVPSRISSNVLNAVVIEDATLEHSGVVPYRRIFQLTNLGILTDGVTGS